jgi:DNA-binding FadR family transcriptional regulator
VAITDTVVQRLESLVLEELEPEAELPSQADLAVQFGVSRLTVREAARSLQARGGTVEDVIEQHALVLDRVRARDAKGAAAMLAHLEQAARDLKAALALTGLPPEER